MDRFVTTGNKCIITYKIIHSNDLLDYTETDLSIVITIYLTPLKIALFRRKPKCPYIVKNSHQPKNFNLRTHNLGDA